MEQSPQIILASASPRRAELLTQIGVRYRVEVADIDEAIRAEKPRDAVKRLAKEKAEVIWNRRQSQGVPVLGSDTIVVCGDTILQKPTSRSEGMAMLEQLSGATHQVMSAVTVIGNGGSHTALSCSEITFREITEVEREVYWSREEPADKAGGYAIQGVAAIFIAHLEGSYSGVMGLPLFETAQLLQQAGVQVL